jgi:PAS domain S-box-containing protein
MASEAFQGMAARVAALDWSTTPLGPRDTWPESLRVAVGICLQSRFPMFIWWGPELINIYNDGYIPMLGARHPHALGRPAREAWAEIWDVVGPQAEAVIERGEATWNERVKLLVERHGYTEETWFTWSYSPIPDGKGRIGGLFCAVSEETAHVIAERERDALLERAQSERARLAEAFEGSPSFLAVLQGPELRVEFANERYFRLVGRSDILGKPIRDALPEVEGQGFFEILEGVYRTGQPFGGTDMRIMLERRPGGGLEEAFVDFVYQPLRGHGGAVNGILAHGIEVTERRQAEIRDRFLLTVEDALRPLTEPGEITAAAAALLGEHLGADRAAYAAVAWEEGTFEVIGDYNRGVASITGHYRVADFGDEFARAMGENLPYVVRDAEAHDSPIEALDAFRATGIRALISVPLHKAGKAVAAMAVHQAAPRAWTRREVELVEHVASRCYESIERARVEATLRRSEASFRELADAMPQIVFAADAQGNVDYFNRQWYEYTGLPEDSGFGYETWKQVHTEEGLRRVAEAWPTAVRTGQTYEVEYPLRRHDGEYRWHLGRALPIRDAAGEIVHWYGTNTDIHDRKQVEERAARALEAEQHARSEAEATSRMKDEFLATLSHELRTPLNAILGWSHMIRRPDATPAEFARGAEVIERNARAQATIIEDLLDMSAIISGKVRLEMADDVDLAAQLLSSCEAVRPAAEAKGVAIACDVGAGPLLARADGHRLQQVLWNLASNAVKFTPAGGRIDMQLARAGDTARIVVRDTGEGIPADFLPYVFDRFRQADASSTRRHGGLGLGLSIVKQLVELHGGTVSVASAGRGRGAAFTLALPLPARAPGRSAAASGAPQAAGSAEARISLAGLRLLVVDDDDDGRELVKRFLEGFGAAVATADSTVDALARLERERFDALVSDIGMPGEDGYALIRRVRSGADGANRDIPAIALTAYARAEDRDNALRAGFDAHAPKPVDPASLIATVARLAKPS